MLIGEKIDQLIKESGITAYKLSKDIYVSQSAISNWISGKKKPIAPLVKLIADYFNVSFDWLLKDKGEMEDGIDSSHGKPISLLKDPNPGKANKKCPECLNKQNRIDELNEKCELYRKLIASYEIQLCNIGIPDRILNQVGGSSTEIDFSENSQL